MASDPLAKVRKEIDAVDDQILDLLVQRMALVDHVTEIKKSQKLAPLQADRFQQMIDRLSTSAQKQGLNTTEVRQVWEAIHRASLAQQEEQMEEQL